MPKKLRTLSGKEIVKFLEKNAFTVSSSRGSHTKLQRIVDKNTQTLIIPLHNQIAKGTLRDIYNQIVQYLPESEIKDFFFTQ
jgi:predicted RNA binding protein YcfA (HicA-like mRNA interferase family)